MAESRRPVKCIHSSRNHEKPPFSGPQKFMTWPSCGSQFRFGANSPRVEPETWHTFFFIRKAAYTWLIDQWLTFATFDGKLRKPDIWSPSNYVELIDCASPVPSWHPEIKNNMPWDVLLLCIYQKLTHMEMGRARGDPIIVLNVATFQHKTWNSIKSELASKLGYYFNENQMCMQLDEAPYLQIDTLYWLKMCNRIRKVHHFYDKTFSQYRLNLPRYTVL